jgi:hypothetical protein
LPLCTFSIFGWTSDFDKTMKIKTVLGVLFSAAIHFVLCLIVLQKSQSEPTGLKISKSENRYLVALFPFLGEFQILMKL